MLGQWHLIECVYCQGAIGENPVWFGGYPYHKECMERRNEINREEDTDGSLHREGGES